jgi:hypothetical protein
MAKRALWLAGAEHQRFLTDIERLPPNRRARQVQFPASAN